MTGLQWLFGKAGGDPMQEEMTSLERCLATIRYEPHDRVPVDLHNFMMTVAGLELPPKTIFQDGQLLGEAQVRGGLSAGQRADY
jgi:hypothetical protein